MSTYAELIQQYIKWSLANPTENANLTYIIEIQYHSELLGFSKWLQLPNQEKEDL